MRELETIVHYLLFLKEWHASLGGLEPPTFRLTAERAHRLRHRDTRGRWSLFSPKASLTTKLGGATCLSHDSSFCSKPRTTMEKESTPRVGSRGEAGRCRRQKGSRASPPLLAPLPFQMQRRETPRAWAEGDPREAEHPVGSVMAPCLLRLYSTTCAAGQRFSRWDPCGRSWKEIRSQEEEWKAGRTKKKGMNETKRPPRKPVRRLGPDPEREKLLL